MTSIRARDIRFKVRSADSEEGRFTAYASVFGNVDSYGEVVVKGAFADTLDEWKGSGAPIPLLWGHNMADPDYNIGAVTDAVEDETGLLVTAQLDMDSPKAAQVFRLVKSGRVNQMSFAFDVLDGADGETEDGQKAYLLKKIRLYEVSVVPIGANQQTEILTVKSALDALDVHGKPASHIAQVRALLAGAITRLDEIPGSAGAKNDDSDATSAPALDLASDPLVRQLQLLSLTQKGQHTR